MNKPQRLRLEHLKTLEPATKTQEQVFQSYADGLNLCISGSAGTGKTFISLYLALVDVMDKDTPYSKVIIVRSAVPTRDMGFLPGSQDEKEAAYTAPYQVIVNDLFEDHDAWNKLTQLKTIEFMTTSYLRGLTFNNAIIIVDEAQNCNYHELCSIITRLGNFSKFIMCGDYYQSDFTKNNDKQGINQFIKIIGNMTSFDLIEFNFGDIVRSGLVRDFIMTKELVDRGKL
tara:strand:+ start:21 stop:707 length:687 start_codon:yes stop_codon:yes gene_type:complete